MSDLLTSLGWLFPVSVFVTSFLASPHCVGMCGPLVLFMGSDRKKLVGYHLGRGLSYFSIGAGAGALGGTALKISTHPLVSFLFIIAFASMLTVVGWKTFTGRSLHFSVVGKLSKISGIFWKKSVSTNKPHFAAAALSGLFSIFLPCGHLYTFALGAAATGGALQGGLMMTAFWLGTLPALGFGLHYLRSRLNYLGPKAHKLFALILIATGLLSLGNFTSHLVSHYPLAPKEDPRSLRCH